MAEVSSRISSTDFHLFKALANKDIVDVEQNDRNYTQEDALAAADAIPPSTIAQRDRHRRQSRASRSESSSSSASSHTSAASSASSSSRRRHHRHRLRTLDEGEYEERAEHTYPENNNNAYDHTSINRKVKDLQRQRARSKTIPAPSIPAYYNAFEDRVQGILKNKHNDGDNDDGDNDREDDDTDINYTRKKTLAASPISQQVPFFPPDDELNAKSEHRRSPLAENRDPEIRLEKQKYIMELEKLRLDRGINLTRRYTINDPLVDIRLEYETFQSHFDAKDQFTELRIGLVLFFFVHERVNNSVGPIVNWNNLTVKVMQNIRRFDRVLEKIQRRYFRAGESSLSWEILKAWIGTLILHHIQEQYFGGAQVFDQLYQGFQNMTGMGGGNNSNNNNSEDSGGGFSGVLASLVNVFTGSNNNNVNLNNMGKASTPIPPPPPPQSAATTSAVPSPSFPTQRQNPFSQRMLRRPSNATE